MPENAQVQGADAEMPIEDRLAAFEARLDVLERNLQTICDALAKLAPEEPDMTHDEFEALGKTP